MARRRFRSRRPRRRMRRRRRKMRIQKTLLGDTRVVKHRYTFAGQVSAPSGPGGGFALTESFNLLSPTNPNNTTGFTGQPLGFDQMNLLFANCQVLGAKVHLTFLPAEGQHQVVYWATIEKSSRLSQPSGDLSDILSRRNTTYKYSMTNPGSTPGTQLTRKHSPAKFNGFKDYKDAEEYQCIPATLQVGANHENYLNFCFSSTHPGSGSLVAACDYAIIISYIIRWFGPIDPPPS